MGTIYMCVCVFVWACKAVYDGNLINFSFKWGENISFFFREDTKGVELKSN